MVWVLPLLREVHPSQLHYPHPMSTNQMLLDFANEILRPKHSLAVNIFMICDIVQCLFTMAFCTLLIVRKGRARKVQFFNVKKTSYGSFIVPNAVWVLLGAVYIYMPTWAGFASYIIYVQQSNRPLCDWLWYIPLPWLPLGLVAFYSGYGFIITCSPRSPISNMKDTVKRLPWYYLPIPKSALVMNTYLISVGVIMFVYNVVVQTLSGKAMARTYSPGHNIYLDFLLPPHTPGFLAQPPTPELLEFVKVGWCGVINVYRHCCLALASYIGIIVISMLQLILYSVPNQIFLINHLCRIFPDPLPERSKRNIWTKTRFLLTDGWPRKLQGSSYTAYKKTWMMAMVGHTQALMLLAAIGSFSVPPLFLFFVPMEVAMRGHTSSKQVIFIIAYVITAAFLAVSWIMGLSAILTFDEAFRALSGMGIKQGETQTRSSGSASDDVESRAHSAARKTLSAVLPGNKSKNSSDLEPLRSPAGLRQMPSSLSCSAQSHMEKVEANLEEYALEIMGNKMVVVIETTVTVDQEEFEIQSPQADREDSQAAPDTDNHLGERVSHPFAASV